MLCFGVVEKDEKLSKIITDGFLAYGYDLLCLSKNKIERIKGQKKEEILLIAADNLNFGGFLNTDVLVFAPEFTETTHEKISCHTAIIPGEFSVRAARLIDAQYAISFGMSHRNTLTVSSIDGNSIVLSLQREIIDIKNRRVERQEIPLKTDAAPETVMAAAAAMIVGGVPPSLITHTMN